MTVECFSVDRGACWPVWILVHRGNPHHYKMSTFSIHSPTIIRGIPLADLWQHLVIVACQNTGRRRLQMIGLILEILMLYKDNLLNSGPCTTAAAASSSSSTVKKIDFGLLRPLWKLYYSLLEDLGEGGSVSHTHASDVLLYVLYMMRLLSVTTLVCM